MGRLLIVLFSFLVVNQVHATTITTQTAVLDFANPIGDGLIVTLCSDAGSENLQSSCSSSFEYDNQSTVDAFGSIDTVTGQFKNEMVLDSKDNKQLWGYSNTASSLSFNVTESGLVEFLFGFDGIITSDVSSNAWNVYTALNVFSVDEESEALALLDGETRVLRNPSSEFFIFGSGEPVVSIFDSSPISIDGLLQYSLDLAVGSYRVVAQTILEGKVRGGSLDMDFTNTSELLVNPITGSFAFDDPLILSDPAFTKVNTPPLLGLLILTLVFGLVRQTIFKKP